MMDVYTGAYYPAQEGPSALEWSQMHVLIYHPFVVQYISLSKFFFGLNFSTFSITLYQYCIINMTTKTLAIQPNGIANHFS